MRMTQRSRSWPLCVPETDPNVLMMKSAQDANLWRLSQSLRATIECIFGWGKQHGTMRKTKHRGIGRVAANFMLSLIAYNLIRIPNLVAA